VPTSILKRNKKISPFYSWHNLLSKKLYLLEAFIAAQIVYSNYIFNYYESMKLM
jgi:hypothetical protein